ncbi:hypothetical protein [Flavobacterium piscisymbiosum]|uniref:Uncharacterized protein n=1 Tax=Flavobacterium piscisymbiosum TaxID=2893753 RepID=A0ABS8MF86_9FLAO|nr:hypothetical protein [Flavobacterium sp. F-30]MCC9064129.1 hypothetical protein [Flavobacterium sp. F-30]
MVVKENLRIIIVLLCCLISCKNDKTAKPIIQTQKITDSLLVIKERKEKYKRTTANNKEILKTIVFENRIYDKENDFTKIKSVLLETPGEIEFTKFMTSDYRKEIQFLNFGLLNHLEYKEPYKEYSPFINASTKKMEFILSYDGSIKISFSNGQYFWFGENYKWLTPKIKVSDSLDYQFYNMGSFKKMNNRSVIHGGQILKFKNKIYLLFFISNGMWWIHHLFDITDEKSIKYCILNSIYGLEDCYGDFNNDGKLDFKQKYAYLRNSEDKSQDKYKVYTLPE